MSNVLGGDKQHQVVALGRLRWSLRRIEQATGVRRETVSGYLKAVGIVVPGCGGPRESKPKPPVGYANRVRLAFALMLAVRHLRVCNRTRRLLEWQGRLISGVEASCSFR